MSMNIYAKEGTKVKVLFDEKGIMNGTDSDKEHAERHLTALSRYTIDHTEVSSWHTTVYLKELPNIPFNSVHFEEVPPKQPPLKNNKTKKQKLIDDSNELIAIFDGWELVEEDMVQRFKKNGYWLYNSELRYHSKWDYLIPIWHKFRDLIFEDEKNEHNHSNFKYNISYRICYGTINDAFISIVSAIQWYNSIK
jgi:hypothetical protein